MRHLIMSFLMWVLRGLLWLRYRVRVEGLDRIPKNLSKTLILPNHPGYIDPAIVLAHTWRKLRPRPMVFAPMLRNPFLFWTTPFLRPVLIPELDAHSVSAKEQAQASINESIRALKEESANMLIYPAGRIYRSGQEYIGSNRGLTEILRAVPDATIVCVRTRGVWGSMFTFARTGELPNLTVCLLRAFGLVLANLLFFLPRRRVHVTVELIDRSRLPELTREKVNPWFEDWYNAPGPEEPTHVPYHFLFGRREYPFPPLKTRVEVNPKDIRAETREAVLELINSHLDRELTADELKPDMPLEELGIDSLERMELAFEIEQRFQFRGETVPTTVLEAWALAQGLLTGPPPPPPPPKWFRKPGGRQEPEVLGDTLPQAFVHRALRSRKDVAVADSMAGCVTYEKMLVGALLMASRFRRIEAPNVGLMLPASVASDIAFFGIHLAGKLPVVINWTTGPGNIKHGCEQTGLTHVVTSRRFVDRANIAIDGVEMLFLEDLRKEFGTLEKLATLLKVRLFGGLVKAATPRPDPSQPCVVLFTSGSERAPKAVPLTHANVIANVRSAIEEFDISRGDSALGFLPAFHSFGLTVMTMMPILAGGRVVHHPDPTDAGSLARKLAAWKPTIVCSTPTFLSYILDHIKEPAEIGSLRIAMVGAEKCPASLFERYERMHPQNGTLLEGYGITECGPAVSANTPQEHRRGSLGRPLPGVDVMLVDAEDLTRPVPDGERGMILVHGPSVFPGYIGEAADPFVTLDGKRWYKTGDLAVRDEEGFIHFQGRLKRFVKAGGEMISLPALEQPLAERYMPDEAGPRVAVEGLDQDGARIVLFTREPGLTLKDANAILADHGMRGVMRIHEVRQVESIPVLGTGKTDYKQLRQWISSPELAPAGSAS